MALKQRKRLGDLLVDAKLISEKQLQKALVAKKTNEKLGHYLVEQQLITEEQLADTLEIQLGIQRVQLNRYPIEAHLIRFVPKDFATKNELMPLKQEANKLVVAMADPMDFFAIEDLRMMTSFQIEPVLALRDEITRAIERTYQLDSSVVKEISMQAESAPKEVDDGMNEEMAPMIQLVNQVLFSALKQRASDIHIEPFENRVFIRYRIDGLLKTVRTFPKGIHSALIARVKIMAQLNITEHRLPQDGRTKFSLEGDVLDLRISTLPTIFGEKIVIRLLNAKQLVLDLEKLDFNAYNLQNFRKLIEQPSGLILLTGPTGSGKTSTLYTALMHLNKEESNIVTIEDPVEYQLEGVNQVQVHNQSGLSFATGLRSILRQDPNIVMIGEIRDKETAEIAVRASLTGHLVFSTLHTNDAIASIPRLIDMGIEPYLVISALSGVVTQRLVRKICKECKEAYEPTKMEMELFEKYNMNVEKLYKGNGCPACDERGYQGRMSIHELFRLDQPLKEMLMNQTSLHLVRTKASQNGMIQLVEDGLEKAALSLTTVEEVLKVAFDH
ncbi:GspE/PulE family protein [Alkalihalobacillus pseudalcaliphilus]|uniref:GspE/PulE family protein n=1 Tax=Alkalihalobacillus pseudalcaliphilus TaxID=79884 RepID=UPI00064E04FF|nr:ATPase, T2SS/T4P/T4SS family [Alkalihalobacillus pseudalcaliphilus]KMK74656.1 type II secretion system protein E [Alkalihalobacillus pseudalcaliphilus]